MLELMSWETRVRFPPEETLLITKCFFDLLGIYTNSLILHRRLKGTPIYGLSQVKPIYSPLKCFNVMQVYHITGTSNLTLLLIVKWVNIIFDDLEPSLLKLEHNFHENRKIDSQKGKQEKIIAVAVILYVLQSSISRSLLILEGSSTSVKIDSCRLSIDSCRWVCLTGTLPSKCFPSIFPVLLLLTANCFPPSLQSSVVYLCG
ncbi:hypothetical protein GQR58_019358 [Nymphon striatum]|nr:hypothetical protein GQR58_019358 [Nymphon striatum]